jgi:putative ABC transport system permease protein
MFKVTLKGLAARKLRLLTTSLAVLLGVAFMTGTMVLTDTIGRTFDNLFADVYAGTDAVVRAESRLEKDRDQRPRLDGSLVGAVSAVSGVAVAEGEVQGYAQLIGTDGKPIGDPDQGAPTLGAAWSVHPDLNPFRIAEGRAPAKAGEIVIDKKSADDGGLGVGDTVSVVTRTGRTDATIAGIARFGTADSPAGASFVLWTPEEAQRLVAEPGKFDSVAVLAEDGVSQERVRDAIAKALPAGFEVMTGAEMTAENQDDMKDALKFFGAFLMTFAVVALLVGSFIIANTFSIVVAQRTREMALLRAVGASRRQVLRSVLLEAAVLGVIASALGLVAGIGVAALLKALLAGFGIEVPSGPIAISANTVVTAFLVGFVVSVGAAYLPARRAARIAPVAAMRAVDVDDSGTSRRRMVIGGVVTGLGGAALSAGLYGSGSGRLPLIGLGALLTFLGVAILGPVLAKPVVRVLGAPLPSLRGTTGTLARANAARNPRRTASTAAALMIGVGLVGFITIFASSAKASIDQQLEKNFRGDFVLDGGWNSGVSPAVTDQIAALAEIEDVVRLRYVTVEIDGEGRMLTATDPAVLAGLYDLDTETGSIADVGPGEIALHQDTADDRGLRVGDTIPVVFGETGRQELTLVATYGRRDVGGSYLIHLDTYAANVSTPVDSMVIIEKVDGVSAAQARSSVEAITDDYPTIQLQDRTEFRDAQASEINTMLGLIYALLGLAVLIALLGIANTLALSVFERTRELGLLRAVGMTRGQLRSAIRWEAVIIALFGAVLGLAVGIFFGWTMVKALQEQGFERFYVPVGQLAVVTLIAALAGVVAAILPARRAAKLDVLQAIATA